MTVNSDKSQLYIILFDFYNSDRNIKERIYNIKLYDLYHYKFYRDITSIIYNGFLTLSLSACKSNTCDGNSNFFSFIIILGYINGANSNIDISNYLSGLNDMTENNLIDIILKDIKIDNNLFGFELEKKLKLITIPQELNFFNIESNGEKTQVNEEGTLNYNYEICQHENIIKNGNQKYYFEFQCIAQDVEVSKFDQYASETKILRSKDYYQDGVENFERKTFYGKTIKIEFELCYELCKIANP